MAKLGGAAWFEMHVSFRVRLGSPSSKVKLKETDGKQNVLEETKLDTAEQLSQLGV